MSSTIQIVFACSEPQALAAFWAEALGYVLQPPPDGFESWEAFADEVGIPVDERGDLAAVVDPTGTGPRLLFERWDTGPPQKRTHIDINSVDRTLEGDERAQALDKERARLEALGAAFHRKATGKAGETWIEMFDPEGNWFCVQ